MKVLKLLKEEIEFETGINLSLNCRKREMYILELYILE